MSDTFLNNMNDEYYKAILARQAALAKSARDADQTHNELVLWVKEYIEGLEAENERLRKAASTLLTAMQKVQNSTTPPMPWPGIAGPANELSKALEGGQ